MMLDVLICISLLWISSVHVWS